MIISYFSLSLCLSLSLIPVTIAVSSLSCVRLSIRGCEAKAPSDCGGKMLCSTTFVSRSTARFDGFPRPATQSIIHGRN